MVKIDFISKIISKHLKGRSGLPGPKYHFFGAEMEIGFTFMSDAAKDQEFPSSSK